MAPLGLPVGKRFFGHDYAGYIVGYDHKKDRGSYLVRYVDGDHRRFKKSQLEEYIGMPLLGIQLVLLLHMCMRPVLTRS